MADVDYYQTLGVGKKASRPDLMIEIVLYEIQSQRLSPAQ